MNVLLLALNAKYIHSSLALRSIKSYCKEYAAHINLLETTINNHENEIIKEIYNASPDIIGVSCYIWNMSLIKTLLPTLKKILPESTIILGGPEVSYDAEELLLSLDADIIMEGEGEITWKEYLDYRFKAISTIDNIKGLIYKSHGIVKRTSERPPLNLADLPFVYSNFEDTQHKIIYYEASRGCPFNCQYCLSSVNSGVRFVPLDSVKKHLQHFYDHRVKQVKFIDRTFNANKSYAMAIWDYLITHDNQYTNFHFEIAAELLDDEMLALLKHARAGLIQFEIGVQSTNPQVLDILQRKMSFDKISQVIQKVKYLGNIHQHLDLIAGLPLETYDSFKRSFNDVIALRPEQFQLGFLKVLRGSGLRRNASQYGLVYKTEPPYEILYTSAITYAEIVRLHSIEELLERYYNSGRFETILTYLFTCFSSPFDFFEKLSIYWEEKGYDLMLHNKISYYLKLIEFIKNYPSINHELSKEFIRFDYLKHEALKEVPIELQTFDYMAFKKRDNELLKNDIYMQGVAPHLAQLSSRARYRAAQIERFKYDVYTAFVKHNSHEAVLLSEPCILLFDYSHKFTRCTLLSEEL
ncbi:B12-binding domain-containing radical SAM protein [Cellulosilyticum sp. I15G10I2]|uniref:B12-binding domain-containing radical SAM protein n=1 Tax=Cellulosilyticum sp. I15G10I2 TaxID=1892843 RepID=UPI00085CACA8|nr:B12-binding domain-containing radical SAM protein [Cellulosilyticum sp. I15G10I2]